MAMLGVICIETSDEGSENQSRSKCQDYCPYQDPDGSRIGTRFIRDQDDIPQAKVEDLSFSVHISPTRDGTCFMAFFSVWFRSD